MRYGKCQLRSALLLVVVVVLDESRREFIFRDDLARYGQMLGWFLKCSYWKLWMISFAIESYDTSGVIEEENLPLLSVASEVYLECDSPSSHLASLSSSVRFDEFRCESIKRWLN